MIGCVGDDAYGTMIINNLKTNNVDTGYVSVLPGQNSGTAHITLAEGDNSIIVIKGANDLVMPKHIDTAWNVIAAADLVMLQHDTAAHHRLHHRQMCSGRNQRTFKSGSRAARSF